MQCTKKHLISLIAGAILIGTSGCGLSSSEVRSLSGNQPAVAQPPASQPLAAPEKNLIAVNVFYPDSNCEALVPEPVAVPEENSLDGAIAKVIERADSADFDLAGYRVDLNNGVATIDLRLSPDSQRHFLSMSACEQFALFGSLRQTLTDNPQWNVKDVRFTENGEDIFF